MVRIIDYKKRTTEEGKDFFVLVIQSGISMVKSATTGKFYATSNKATLSSTFDEETCKALIGTELAGKVEKVTCEEYEYVIKETGEIITLTHRFEYVDEVEHQEKAITQKVEKSKTTVDEFVSNINEENAFSSNGVLEHA